MKLRTINGFTLLVAAATGAIALAVHAQEPSSPPSYSARDEQARWINDPHFRQFFDATVAAFANGPDQVDRAAYEDRSRAIFESLAIANDIPVEGFLEHMAAIPGEMIFNITREPDILSSYDNFVEALFGPQSFPSDAVE